jgi:hypothetical protein
MRVRMTCHGARRGELRAGIKPKKLRPLIERRLQGMLRAGVRPDPALGVRVPVGDGLVAICVPSLFGGWDIVTVRPDREEEAG